MSLVSWAIRHGVSAAALEELREMFGTMPVHVPKVEELDRSETGYVMPHVRLEGAAIGIRLFRNNVGALPNPETGGWTRFGLANDSKALNDKVKSADLIGWKPVLIRPEHVGQRIAQFVSRECKAPGWKWSGDAHELAQRKWAEVIVADGGDAAFCSGPGSLRAGL